MNFNPTRTKYINQSPKLPRATGLVAFADACYATQVESRRYHPIAPSNKNTTPPSSPFFYESYYGQEESKNKPLHCRDRHQGEQHYIDSCATPSSQQPMSRRRKLDSILKSAVDDLLLKSNRRGA